MKWTAAGMALFLAMCASPAAAQPTSTPVVICSINDKTKCFAASDHFMVHFDIRYVAADDGVAVAADAETMRTRLITEMRLDEPAYMKRVRIQIYIVPGLKSLGSASIDRQGRMSIRVQPIYQFGAPFVTWGAWADPAARAMRALTVAHELFHLFQYGYRNPLSDKVHIRWLREATAVWVEDLIVPVPAQLRQLQGFAYYKGAWEKNVSDHLSLFAFGSHNQQYAGAAFLEFAANDHPDGKALLRTIWQLARALPGKDGDEVLATALGDPERPAAQFLRHFGEFAAAAFVRDPEVNARYSFPAFRKAGSSDAHAGFKLYSAVLGKNENGVITGHSRKLGPAVLDFIMVSHGFEESALEPPISIAVRARNERTAIRLILPGTDLVAANVAQSSDGASGWIIWPDIRLLSTVSPRIAVGNADTSASGEYDVAALRTDPPVITRFEMTLGVESVLKLARRKGPGGWVSESSGSGEIGLSLPVRETTELSAEVVFDRALKEGKAQAPDPVLGIGGLTLPLTLSADGTRAAASVPLKRLLPLAAGNGPSAGAPIGVTAYDAWGLGLDGDPRTAVALAAAPDGSLRIAGWEGTVDPARPGGHDLLENLKLRIRLSTPATITPVAGSAEDIVGCWRPGDDDNSYAFHMLQVSKAGDGLNAVVSFEESPPGPFSLPAGRMLKLDVEQREPNFIFRHVHRSWPEVAIVGGGYTTSSDPQEDASIQSAYWTSEPESRLSVGWISVTPEEVKAQYRDYDPHQIEAGEERFASHLALEGTWTALSKTIDLNRRVLPTEPDDGLGPRDIRLFRMHNGVLGGEDVAELWMEDVATGERTTKVLPGRLLRVRAKAVSGAHCMASVDRLPVRIVWYPRDVEITLVETSPGSGRFVSDPEAIDIHSLLLDQAGEYLAGLADYNPVYRDQLLAGEPVGELELEPVLDPEISNVRSQLSFYYAEPGPDAD